MKKQLLVTAVGTLLICSFLIGFPFTDSPRSDFSIVPEQISDNFDFGASELFGPFARDNMPGYPLKGSKKPPPLPQNLMVIMVEFSDHRFTDTITNPDFLANPDYSIKDFIERNIYHLQSYYLDVSKGQYMINYEVVEPIVTLSQSMEFYGNQSNSLARRIKLIEDTISFLSESVDFSSYDSYMILHAGPGKETDVYGTNPNTIPSSFINRSLMRHILDPDNDDFPGIPSGGGNYISEIVVAASHQRHSDTSDINYGVQGILSYLFGRQIGLPTLFGNVSSLGRAAGAGNFCLMGTGSWNANGFVPPFLSAWSRYFIGWDEPVDLDETIENVILSYPFNPYSLGFPTIYKVTISADEYYLIENRQQNPDGSTLNGWPNFTFKLLPDGEQDYYAPPNSNVPRFNFMKNTYRGCEWDFFLPGLGDMEAAVSDGSGILIWHIDESIIRERYSSNTINADPSNQGVTLVEADGIQHMQSGMPHIYMRGSPYDSFRANHNDYFGNKIKEDGVVSIPYSQGKYGNTGIEFYNISDSEPVMTLSVNLPASIKIGYSGTDISPLAVLNYSLSGPLARENNGTTLFLTASSGRIFMLQNDDMLPAYPVETDSIPQLYTFSSEHNAFFVPTFSEAHSARLLMASILGVEILDQYPGHIWSSHPLVVSSENENDWALVLALFDPDQNQSRIVIYGYNLIQKAQFIFPGREIASNLVYTEDYLYFLTAKNDSDQLSLASIDWSSYTVSQILIEGMAGKKTLSLLATALSKELDQTGKHKINLVALTEDNLLYSLESGGTISTGFPLALPENILSVPIMQDITGNGYMEILLLSSNSLFVIGYNGELLTFPEPASQDYPTSTDLPLGIISFDTNGDGRNEIIATLGGQRLVTWDNRYRTIEGYPLFYSKQLLNAPVASRKDDTVIVYLSAEDGRIYQYPLLDASLESSYPDWASEYVNLQRTAFYNVILDQNLYQSEQIFVPNESYAFPNPVTSQNGGIVYFNIMTNRNTDVSVKIFDISGKLIFKDIYTCEAYMSNRNKLAIDFDSLSSGIYFALLQAGNAVKRIRFAVEK